MLCCKAEPCCKTSHWGEEAIVLWYCPLLQIFSKWDWMIFGWICRSFQKWMVRKRRYVVRCHFNCDCDHKECLRMQTSSTCSDWLSFVKYDWNVGHSTHSQRNVMVVMSAKNWWAAGLLAAKYCRMTSECCSQKIIAGWLNGQTNTSTSNLYHSRLANSSPQMASETLPSRKFPFWIHKYNLLVLEPLASNPCFVNLSHFAGAGKRLISKFTQSCKLNQKNSNLTKIFELQL